MEAHAGTAVPCSVDVHLTDPREWTTRAEHVTASFKASLDRDLITLLDRPAFTPPDWSKPMSKPATNLDEASTKLDNISDHLCQLCDRMLPSALERVAEEDWMRDRELKNRRRFACGHAADAIEMSIKTVIAVHGVSPSRTHDLEALIKQIPSKPHRDQITTVLVESGEDAKAQMPPMIRAAHALAVYADTVHTAAGGQSSAPGVLTFWLGELKLKAAEGFGVDI